MAKSSTFPYLFDSTCQIDISKLKGWGFLKLNQTVQTTLSWSSQGEKTASISLFICTIEENPFIELKYNSNSEPRTYRVKLFWKESNLNQGKVWFFICPKTFRYCRKLYLIEGYFLSRAAFKGLNCMYEKQTYSKYGRSLDNLFGAYYGSEKAYEQIYSKHFKKYYAGKPTKKYLKLMQKARRSESVSIEKVNSTLFGNRSKNA